MGEAAEPSRDWVVEHYGRRGWTLRACAREWGCTREVMRAVVAAAGLSIRPGSGRADIGELHPPPRGAPTRTDSGWTARLPPLPMPATPPPGPVGTAVSLVAHRAAAFQPAVQEALRRHLGGQSRPQAGAAAGCSPRALDTALTRAAQVPPPEAVTASAALLARLAPVPVPEAGRLLTAAGLVADPGEVPLAIGAGRFWQVPMPTRVDVGTTGWLVRAEHRAAVNEVGRLATSAATRDGLVAVPAVLSTAAARRLPARLAHQAATADLQVLAGDPPLLAVPDDRGSRLAAAVDRMLLAAQSPVSLTDVVTGVRRALGRRPGAVIVSADRLTEWLAAQPAYRLAGGNVRLLAAPSARLRPLERLLVDQLRAAPDRRLPLSALADVARCHGYSPAGVRPALSTSPAVLPVRRPLWRLPTVA